MEPWQNIRGKCGRLSLIYLSSLHATELQSGFVRMYMCQEVLLCISITCYKELDSHHHYPPHPPPPPLPPSSTPPTPPPHHHHHTTTVLQA